MLADGALHAKRRDGLMMVGELTGATGNEQAARWQWQKAISDGMGCGGLRSETYAAEVRRD